MAQYVDKDALIAEIEKVINEINPDIIEDWRYRLQRERDIKVMKNILSLIDTLEVKEVNLEKEFDNYTKNILACDVQSESFTHLYNCAKHFFELGLKSQKEK